ncbi:AN1-type zinc finger protein 1-like [Sarcoptes scabiei]|nr:AN1-type zinc finger protein 1-like [Sarcoptes scabiei]
MSRHGHAETDQLKSNLENQLDRLIAQLADLESNKDDLDPDEYQETKNETIEQMKEFNETLAKLKSGDMTLVDEIGSLQFAIQVAISDAFKTPEVIKLFARKEPAHLRLKLSEIERNHKIGSFSKESFLQQKTEILCALKKLNDKLSDEEITFLKNYISAPLKEFIEIKDYDDIS